MTCFYGRNLFLGMILLISMLIFADLNYFIISKIYSTSAESL